MDKEKRKKIGERLQQVRKALGLLQKDVAKEFGIGRTQMTNIEKGKTIPAYLLQWLSETHNVSLDWLFLGVGDMFIKRATYHVDVKMMIEDFEEHPEFMHRILSEYYMLKCHFPACPLFSLYAPPPFFGFRGTPIRGAPLESLVYTLSWSGLLFNLGYFVHSSHVGYGGIFIIQSILPVNFIHVA